MDYVQKTIQAYDAAAEKYASVTDQMVCVREMDTMLGLMNSDNKNILDVGCGPGRDARVFTEKGCAVTGIDMSKELIKIARQSNPENDYRLMDVRKLEFPDGSFGAAWCYAVLLHLNDSDLEKAVKELYRVLISGGVIAVSFKEGEGEKEVLETFSTDLARYYNFKTQSSLHKLMVNAGFEVAETFTINERKRFGEDKRDLNWVWSIAKKP